MAQYRYLAYNLLTNAAIAELPMEGPPQIQWAISAPVTISGKVPLTEANAAAMEEATRPCVTAVFVERNRVLLDGGIIWKRQYSVGGGYDLQISGFSSYFYRRLAVQSATAAQKWVNVDQLAVPQQLITQAQAVYGGNIGVIVDLTQTSGVLRSLTLDPSQLPTIGSVIDQQAALDNGFDWDVRVAYDNSGAPAKYLRLGYPQSGRTVGQAVDMLQYPGNITSYSLAEDGEQAATSTWGQATLENGAASVQVASSPEMLTAGYPILERTVSLPDTRNTATLLAATTAEQKAAAGPVATLTASVKIEDDSRRGIVPGSFQAGDTMRVAIKDKKRFPYAVGNRAGVDRFFRCIGATLTCGPDEALDMQFGDVISL